MKCPFSKKDCLKEKCELWVKLLTGGKEQGRCAIAWGVMLLTEIRAAIERKPEKKQ